jgi:hypothetical protein
MFVEAHFYRIEPIASRARDTAYRPHPLTEIPDSVLSAHYATRAGASKAAWE